MKTTKTKTLAILVLALGLMVCPAELAGAATIGTAFTYQGRLVDDNSVANGVYDFQFKVFDRVILGNQQGSTIYIYGLNVIDGNFTVELDFGSGIFYGDARWLEIGVRPGGSTDSFTILSPLQEVKPTPNSIHATHALQADEADTLNGLDSSAFAVTAHSHDGVYALISHTHSGSDITSGTVADIRIADSIARDLELTWGKLAGIPAGFADGIDNIGNGDITAVLASTGLTGGGTTGDVTLGIKVPLSLSDSSLGPIISGTNTGTGYAGDFGQTGASNINGGLNVTTAAGLYGAKILNRGGYSGYSYGLWADATSTNSSAYGGYFKANTGGKYAHGIAIDADNTMATAGGGYSYGIKLDSDCANGTAYGIYSDVGVGSGSTSNLYGIYSYGTHSGTSGTSYGMWSRVYGSDGGDSYGIYSEGRKYSSDTAGKAYGGYFIGDNDRTGGESYGLYTTATGLNGYRYGLYSEVTTSSAYRNYGLYTEVANNNNNSYGLYADLDPGSYGYGVYVDLDTTMACTVSQIGLWSSVNHQGTGGNVYGVQSTTHSSDTGKNYAGYFSANSNPGDTGPLYGIYAYCDNDTSGDNLAGYFYGDVVIAGMLDKSGGSFKIDHPLDPENKYLSHSFVESPDMMNVYNGNAALDENGEACVQLPEYFETLNRDFRYQLTCIGGFAPVYIAEEISNNRFKIAGGKRGMKVSWQVTGVRHDPYAVANRVQVEEEKNNEERGYYLNPMAYGLPEEKGIESVRNPRVSETRQVAKGDVSYETD